MEVVCGSCFVAIGYALHINRFAESSGLVGAVAECWMKAEAAISGFILLAG
jgi:hypothetical protein